MIETTIALAGPGSQQEKSDLTSPLGAVDTPEFQLTLIAAQADKTPADIPAETPREEAELESGPIPEDVVDDENGEIPAGHADSETEEDLESAPEPVESDASAGSIGKDLVAPSAIGSILLASASERKPGGAGAETPADRSESVEPPAHGLPASRGARGAASPIGLTDRTALHTSLPPDDTAGKIESQEVKPGASDVSIGSAGKNKAVDGTPLRPPEPDVSTEAKPRPIEELPPAGTPSRKSAAEDRPPGNRAIPPDAFRGEDRFVRDIKEAVPGREVSREAPGGEVRQTKPGEAIREAVPGREVSQAASGGEIRQTKPGEAIRGTVPGEEISRTVGGAGGASDLAQAAKSILKQDARNGFQEAAPLGERPAEEVRPIRTSADAKGRETDQGKGEKANMFNESGSEKAAPASGQGNGLIESAAPPPCWRGWLP